MATLRTAGCLLVAFLAPGLPACEQQPAGPAEAACTGKCDGAAGPEVVAGPTWASCWVVPGEGARDDFYRFDTLRCRLGAKDLPLQLNFASFMAMSARG